MEHYVDAASVQTISPSPSRTPVAIETKLYAHGETHMGGFVVTFVLKDGDHFGHSGGSGDCGFVSVPAGYTPDDIIDVVFPSGRFVKAEVQSLGWLHAPDSELCIFRQH